MRLKYRIKFILAMISIACLCLLGVNLDFLVKDSDFVTDKDKASRIIIESPEKPSIPNSKTVVNEDGRRVAVPSKYGNPMSPVQPLPLPDPNIPIVITPLS